MPAEGDAARARLQGSTGRHLTVGRTPLSEKLVDRLALLLSWLTLSAAPIHAQQERAPAPARPSGWALVPQVAIGPLGNRWEGVVTAEPDSADPMRRDTISHWQLRPGTAPVLGVTLQYRTAGRFTYELLGSYTATDYAVDIGPDADHTTQKIRGAGSIRLLRLMGGIHFRLRPSAPGYFSLGAGATYYRPAERIRVSGGEGREPLFDDRAQWMPAGHVGAGIDLPVGRETLRLDGRVYGSRPAQERVTHVSGEPRLEARVALDWLLGVGYVIRF